MGAGDVTAEPGSSLTSSLPPADFVFEYPCQIALAQGFLEQRECRPNSTDVECIPALGQHATHIPDVLLAPGKKLRDDQIFRADETDEGTGDVDRHGSLKKLLLEPRPAEDEIEGKPGCAVFQRHNACGPDEGGRSVDTEREAMRLERTHQVVGRDAALNGHIHIRRQARPPPDQCRLCAEYVPRSADRTQRNRQIREEFSRAGG